MKEIVLDKCYLDAATPEQILALHGEHRLLMPDVLFYELITAKKASMRNCFNKFPEVSSPVALIPNVGTLLRYELITRNPCTPLYKQRERAAFSFNSKLRTSAFHFTEAQLEGRTNQEEIIKQWLIPQSLARGR